MERVAFLVEETNARISAMLNPESVTMRRQSGVALRAQRPAISANGQVAQSALSTGGGHTELDCELVFDTSLQLGGSIQSKDVRDLTRPIWALAEARSITPTDQRPERQPFVRFVWGKSWNLRALVLNVAERFEMFDSLGRPSRSWMRLRLLIVEAPEIAPDRLGQAARVVRSVQVDEEPVVGDKSVIHIAAQAADGQSDVSTDRLDALANRYFGDPNLWRLIARANGLNHPDRIAPGQRLVIPDPPKGG